MSSAGIFHKQRDFGESSSDSSDGSESDSTDDGNCDDACPKKQRKADDPAKDAPGGTWSKQPKNKKKIPDYQRYHA